MGISTSDISVPCPKDTIVRRRVRSLEIADKYFGDSMDRRIDKHYIFTCTSIQLHNISFIIPLTQSGFK